MVFSSHLFCFYFLPLALGTYYALPRAWRNPVLALISYLFYGWANPAFTLLMLLSTAVDFICGLVMTRGHRRHPERPWQLEKGAARTSVQRLALLLSLFTNLGLLAFFKYFHFAVDSWNELAHGLGLAVLSPALQVVLPLGISFYTFQSMSYSIDVYRGEVAALRRPLDFACYVSMFPQLVAGPIVRYAEVADQLQARQHSTEKLARGAAFFCLGMAKKVLLANPCGSMADATFAAGSPHALDAWVGLIAYAFQIYFDFSGYSDMAIGLGLMLGFTFPKNFDSPYRSASITEFWQRWHLSLSRWLRDYLYIPLGGNRGGALRTYRNLLLVMLLGGLWHGASWTFVLWGLWHGTLLAWERFRGHRRADREGSRSRSFALAGLAQARTFGLVLLGWVLFRAESLSHALDYYTALFGLGADRPEATLIAAQLYRPYPMFTLVLAAAVVWLGPQTWDWTRRLSLPRCLVCLTLLWLALTAMETQGYNPFIYFIF